MFALTGVHHVSALSAHIQRTHQFNVRVLGLRPVLKTVNQDEPSMYHLFYGDAVGSPGSDLTVFDLPGAVRERPGNNSISGTTLRVAGERQLAFWADWLDEHRVARGEVGERDARGVLDFADAEGMQLSLVADGGTGDAFPWEGSPVPAEHQIRGLGYPQIVVPERGPTERFLTEGLGLEHARAYEGGGESPHEVHVYAMGEGGVNAEVHVSVEPHLARARYGAGGVHHVALRVPEGGEMVAWVQRLSELGYPNSGIVERYYFRSIYVREPNGVLFELATDGPGFAVDGPLGAERLKLPPFLESRRGEIEARLVPIAA